MADEVYEELNDLFRAAVRSLAESKKFRAELTQEDIKAVEAAFRLALRHGPKQITASLLWDQLAAK